LKPIGGYNVWYNADFNAEIIKFIQSFSSPFWGGFFQFVTMIGEQNFLMTAFAVIYWCINKDFGYRMGFAALSNGVINSGIKETLKIPRPIGEPGIRSLRLETAEGYSFPSGHSQTSASIFTSLMVQLRKRWVYYLGSLLISLVGVSRMYLGVHRPVDVLAGIVLGVSWVFVVNYMFDISERTGSKIVFLAFIIPMILLLPLMPNPEYHKASGTALAFYLGYVIESKYIKFQERAGFLFQILKIALGLAVMITIKELLKLILPEVLTSDFIRYFLIGIWGTIAWPYLFNKLGMRIKT